MADLTDFWKAANWTIFRWLDSPKKVVVAALPLVLVALWPRSPALLKLLGRGLGVLLALYVALAAPPVAALLVGGLTAFVPETAAQPADQIVVLSRGDDLGFDYSRYDLAIQLWQEDYAPTIFVTNYWKADRTAKRLVERDIPLQVLAGSSCSRTTYEEAVSTATLLQPEKNTPIILITDPPHMLRAMLTFEALGFAVYPRIAPFPPRFSTTRKSMLAIREYFGLANYAVLGRLKAQPLAAAKASFDGEVSAERCALALKPG